MRKILLNRKAPVLAQEEEVGTCMFKTTLIGINGNRLNDAKKTFKTLPHPLFYIMVASTSKLSISLSKRMIVATLGAAPSKKLSVGEERPVDAVYAVPICKSKENRHLQFDQHQQVAKTDREN